MITDAQLAQASFDIYDPATAWNVVWSNYGVDVGLRIIGDDCIIAFRGTDTPRDLLIDGDVPVANDPDIGHVHTGFRLGMRFVLVQIEPQINGRQVYLTGHSLGAARALIMLALLRSAHIDVAGCTVFAPPRAGFADFVSHITGARWVWNSGDPVPLFPLHVPELFPFEPAPGEPVMLHERPTLIEIAEQGNIAFHHMGLYLRGYAG